MDTLIPVVIILAVVCFVGYKNREKLSALYDRIQNDRLDDEPEVITPAPEVSTPYKIEPVNAATTPQNQEQWSTWRSGQAPSTQAYIPEKFTPDKTASGDKVEAIHVAGVVPMPKSVGEAYTRVLVNLKAGQLYSLKMAVTNKNPNRSVGLTPTTSDPARLGASYFIKLIGAAGEIPYKSRPGNAFKQFRNLAPGDYTVEITSDKDSQVFAHFK